MRQMLAGVVDTGTGTKAADPRLPRGGQDRHRAQAAVRGRGKYVASFVGFAPAENPRLATIVVLDEPDGQYFGGQVAAPVFSRIMQYALRVERVPGS